MLISFKLAVKTNGSMPSEICFALFHALYLHLTLQLRCFFNERAGLGANCAGFGIDWPVRRCLLNLCQHDVQH